jgi:hypothetical protein
VGLVDDDGVVGAQIPVGLDFGKQHAVGQHLEITVLAHTLVETQLVADATSQMRIEFRGDARGGAARRYPPRLRVSDEPGGTAAHLQTNFRDLGGFPRAGFAAHDDDRVRVDGPGDVGDPAADGKLAGKARIR